MLLLGPKAPNSRMGYLPKTVQIWHILLDLIVVLLISYMHAPCMQGMISSVCVCVWRGGKTAFPVVSNELERSIVTEQRRKSTKHK